MMFTSIPFRDPLYLKRKIYRRILQIILTWQTQRGRHNVADKLRTLRKPRSCVALEPCQHSRQAGSNVALRELGKQGCHVT